VALLLLLPLGGMIKAAATTKRPHNQTIKSRTKRRRKETKKEAVKKRTTFAKQHDLTKKKQSVLVWRCVCITPFRKNIANASTIELA
jgi:hypothetical protein